ncbi:MAG: cytochrome c nitrite reductase small subunit [Bacteroidetes bacterium]|nr:cytochrome c nitrite reductase small subunit [Bacteroidota bacterium]
MHNPSVVLFLVAVGLTGGIGIYTFIYARGYMYFTDSPEACANCHSMSSQFSVWLKGSHRHVAVCNDCHTPPTFVSKYYTKAVNGFWHSWYFTTEAYQDNILARKRTKNILERACRHCHGDIVEALEHTQNNTTTLSCVQCHSTVGH